MKKISWETLLVTLVAFWGLSFSMTKPLLVKIGVFNFLAYRFVIGGFSLLLLLIVLRKLQINKKTIRTSVITGLLLFAAFYCHIEGLKYTTVAKNSFLVGSSVIFIPFIMLVIYKEKSSKLVLLQTIMSITGLALITLVASSGGFNYGDMITMIGTFLYALYTIAVEKGIKDLHVSTFTAIQLSTVGLLSLIATFIFEDFTMSFTAPEWFNLLFLAIVLTGVFYYLLAQVQKNLSASNITVIFTLEPFFATLFGWFILKEMIGINTVVGGLMILLAVLLPYMGLNKKKSKLQTEIND